jgi:hypothetical protein
MRPLINPGSTMLAEPRWFYDAQTNTMVINLINITSDDTMAKAGIGTVQMTLGQTKYLSYQNINEDIYINYTSSSVQDYTVAWDTYFTNSLKVRGHPTLTKYILPTTTNPSLPATLVIKIYEVHIKNI